MRHLLLLVKHIPNVNAMDKILGEFWKKILGHAIFGKVPQAAAVDTAVFGPFHRKCTRIGENLGEGVK